MIRMPDLSLTGSLDTRVGQVVARATSDLLLQPDWGINLELCDFINRDPNCAPDAVRALRKQLRAGNSTKIAFFALIAAETCVKNCAVHMHSAMATREFMDDMAAIAMHSTTDSRGEENKEKALTLIQEWALAFERRMPVFQSTYQALRMKGVRFPAPPEDAAPIFTPTGPAAPAAPHAAEGPSAEEKMAKLAEDLKAVAERIKACRDVLPQSPGIDTDATLSEHIGFLEACKPRMVALVEAGMNGELTEDLLSTTLTVNDALINTLEAEERGTAVPNDELYKVLGEEKPNDNLLLPDDGEAKTEAATADLNSPPAGSNAAPPAGAQAMGPASFDPFAPAGGASGVDNLAKGMGSVGLAPPPQSKPDGEVDLMS